ncbi:DUF3284 domain-containing protein [Lapidilactobacillus gannanensis]|jgi:hypothetical protein|uniref:DUF3284 domain-containing protein n=1 Tax=Lapidilactobacillus gannanensis TaxID=2486002 RepID=A0ABW4BLR7_9LACO|nr:DUF3284 domain-containing protein [Lapidilactobacillus gannanensis]MCH4057177.1 DUF3284 domain-containing protein [Lactobacillaceae bacterium]
MKIIKTLNVPSSYLYRKVIDSVLYDIRSQTKESIDEANLEGYSYVKTFSKTTAARLTVTKLIPNEAYHYETESNKSTFKVSYDMKSLPDNKTELTYEESVVSDGWMKQMNDLLVGWILGWMRRRNFKKMLTQIEESY